MKEKGLSLFIVRSEIQMNEDEDRFEKMLASMIRSVHMISYV
jgi:hypothetical protein